jgi:hypothetical protein
MGWREQIAALLGVSAYTAPPAVARSLGDAEVEQARERFGGQLAPPAYTQTRWFLADIEAASLAADNGDLSYIARLVRAMHGDGVFVGHLKGRTGKAVRLPRRFSGDAAMVEELTGRDGARSVFEDMCPATELERLADDAVMLGVFVGELMPVKGRDYPVLVRLEPEHLRYRWSENRWYYQSVFGELAITPGDGRWVLGTPGGRMSPWQAGLWRSCGEAYVDKAHAKLHLANWEAKLANAARVASSPAGATDTQRQGWFQKVAAWGVNTVFETPPGYTVSLLESNGNGWESGDKTIARSERTYAIAISGQEATEDGGKAFGNASVPERVHASLVDVTADGIAYTINTQVTPQWVVRRHGEEALARMPILQLATKPAKDLKAQADTMVSVAAGMAALREELAKHNPPRALDVAEYCTEYVIPIAGDVDGDGNPDDEGGPVEVPPAPAEEEPANDNEEAAA